MKLRVLVACVLMMLMAVACAKTPPSSMPAPIPASPTGTAEPAAPTTAPAKEAATAAPTSAPGASAPTSAAPPAAGAPQPKPINFPAGVTSVAVHSTAPANGIDRYQLRILAGQTLMLDLPNQQGVLALAVWGADGTVLISDHADAIQWSGPIPKTQDYFVDVKALTNAPVSYLLQVTIPALPPTAQPQPPAKPITFAPGATSATVQGVLQAGAVDRHVLRVVSGQTMNVTIPNLEGQVVLIVWGADGTVLLSDHAGATSWGGPIPKTQDYFIDVRSVSGAPLSYTMTVAIPPLPAPTAQPQPKRIVFSAGSTSATLQGTLQPQGVDHYVIKVNGGQTLIVEVPGMQGKVSLVIWGADGTVLASGAAGTNVWSGPLPTTQDYFIDVRSLSATGLTYTLKVTVPALPSPAPQPKRIQFAAGAVGATVHGSLGPHSADRWILGVGAGQTMNVNVDTSQGQVILVIWGVDGTVLLSDHVAATTWSGQVPKAQDYFISVRAVGSTPAQYTLKVTIPPK